VKNPNVLRAEIKEKKKSIREAKTKEAREKAEQEHDRLVGEIIDRSIAVFGTINVRTDGKRVVVAQKLEQPRSPGQKWDIYQLERVGAGPLQFISGH
jgi:hypothetical protein